VRPISSRTRRWHSLRGNVRPLSDRRRLAPAVISALLVLTVASCDSNTARDARPATEPTVVALGADHLCVVPGSGSPVIHWSDLHNPIMSSPSAGEKDEEIVWFAGRWHMLFSYVRDDKSSPGGVYWDVATSTSTDLTNWSPPVAWPAQPGTLGVAAPEIARDPDGAFVVTYQSDPGQTDGAQDLLYYRTSTNLESWSSPHPLAQNLAPEPTDRMIDGSLAWTGNGLILGYKAGEAGNEQAFEIAWSPNGSLSGPWRYVGKPDIVVYGGTIERYEFLAVGGSWHLMATSNVLDQPWLFELAGDPGKPTGWLDWTGGYELDVPKAKWDTGKGISSVNYEWANASFLCNDTADSGYYYLFYAGSNELTAFDGWGHAKIGIARSRDLVHWQVPG
jgi:hypothetical protein